MSGHQTYRIQCEGIPDSQVLDALRDFLPRFEAEAAEAEEIDERIMAEFSREQGLAHVIALEPLISKTRFGRLQMVSTPEPEYCIPSSLGWARRLMSRSLFERVFEPYVNDLLADRVERRQQHGRPCGKPTLTGTDRFFIACTGLTYTIWTAATRLLQSAFARISWR